MLDMARNRPIPPDLVNPPDWLVALQGFDLFQVEPNEHGWSAHREGTDENTEYPSGTWRVILVMPVDLSITNDYIDPLVLLVVLAHGATKVEDKVHELVDHCRDAGKSWTQIGHALGITKQSAWERFSGED
jgi:hypothetical protein